MRNAARGALPSAIGVIVLRLRGCGGMGTDDATSLQPGAFHAAPADEREASPGV
jgi:hypothetical protein